MQCFEFFAPCPRGLEAALAAELAEIGLANVRPGEGGARFSGGFEAVCRANLWSRIASRILLKLAEGTYRDEDDIYRLAREQRWEDWFEADHSIRIDLTARRSPLRSLDFTALRIKDAICDRMRELSGRRPDVDTRNPAVRIYGHAERAQATLYIDTSGDPLFKRGYRQAGGEAPLRENLAAGMLRLAGWRPGIGLHDPMCGSGTLLTEAAMIATGLAPGAKRLFGFERLSFHDATLWRRLRQSAIPDISRTTLGISGADRDRRAIDAAHANLTALGLEERVTLQCADMLDAPAPAPEGILVMNPPYGVRLDDKERLARVYPLLGDALKRSYTGWTCFILSSELALPSLIRLAPSRRTPLYNGAIECRLFEFRIVSGSNRR